MLNVISLVFLQSGVDNGTSYALQLKPLHNLNVVPVKEIWQEVKQPLGKSDCTVYVRSPESDFQSQRENDFSKVTQFHARYDNETLLSKATIKLQLTLA